MVILYHHAGWGFSFEGVNYITAPFYRNHVNYGALLVCMIPVAFGLSRTTGGVWTYILGILLVALYFTYSRGAWMALVLAIVAVWLMRRKWLMWAFVLFSVGITTAAIWLVKDNNYLRYRPSFERTIYHGDLNDHLIATYALRDLSTVERFYRWIAASRMVSGHWITGYGPNTFYPTYMTYTVSEYRTYVSDNPEHSTVHNYFLLLLVEQGLPGMLLFYFLYLLMLWEAQRFYHRTEHSFRKGVSMIIVAILIMVGALNLLSDLIETDKVGTIFYCCTGVLIALRASETITVSHQAHREERSPID